MPRKQQTSTLRVRLSPTEMDALQYVASKHGRSMNAQAIAMLEEALSEVPTRKTTALRTLTSAVLARIRAYISLVGEERGGVVTLQLFLGAIQQLGHSFGWGSEGEHTRQIGEDIGEKLAYDTFVLMNRPSEALNDRERDLVEAAKQLGITPRSEKDLKDWSSHSRTVREV